ncbi:MAG: aminotransferase class I/II-fold pyridoxal phosphate-dependent enzyme [Candidatus Thiosymbion ectosymbiont of Robbea hypermnestra]|nr:aminotransferase class I/II-fold pyridoxal phosphate-dependent enzyme [Candidatus Thiosymbion ectosymbiont of Robbea hypermnestra]
MTFTKCFNNTDPIPSEGIKNAVRLMKTGRLYRYNDFNTESGDKGNCEAGNKESVSEVAKLEDEFARYTGHRYVIGVNSCGSAMFLALKAAGVRSDDKVFSNSFTFTAVPSSIIHAGGIPVYVECNRQYVVDTNDFEKKIEAHPDARYFLLSYMRGHISDMDKIKELCDKAGIYMIEDWVVLKLIGCYNTLKSLK